MEISYKVEKHKGKMRIGLVLFHHVSCVGRQCKKNTHIYIYRTVFCSQLLWPHNSAVIFETKNYCILVLAIWATKNMQYFLTKKDAPTNHSSFFQLVIEKMNQFHAGLPTTHCKSGCFQRRRSSPSYPPLAPCPHTRKKGDDA